MVIIRWKRDIEKVSETEQKRMGEIVRDWKSERVRDWEAERLRGWEAERLRDWEAETERVCYRDANTRLPFLQPCKNCCKASIPNILLTSSHHTSLIGCGNECGGGGRPSPGNTKGGSITVPLTSWLTGLESAVWQLMIFVFICKTD